MEGARYPLQARCAQLARMGCVVFHYDMVGYADCTAIPHRAGFTDAEAELRLQSFMGLQTWNSIRVARLPAVACRTWTRAKIGVTGASGGGTQTFMLGAIDDRPAVAFPAVMVSTAMQGGCVCENCSYLRVGTGNVEFAGLFAPKPLAMSAANDWTIEIEKKGLPELKQLYTTARRPRTRSRPSAGPSSGTTTTRCRREMMYAWFNKHLLGGSERGQGAAVQADPAEGAECLRRRAPAAEGRTGRKGAAGQDDRGGREANEGPGAEGREVAGRVPPRGRHGPAGDDR